MKIARLCLLIGLISVVLNAAASQQQVSAPFDNVILNPASTLVVSYSFGSNQSMICYTPDFAPLGIMTWPLNGAPQSSYLPVVLSINSNVTGSPADPNGTITIANTITDPILLSCDFAF